MGGKSSKGQILDTRPPNLPPPEPVYMGPGVKYHFVDCEVSLQYTTLGFMSSSVITSNVDNYYPMLAEQYAKGLRLLSFYRIPLQMRHQGFFNPSVLVKFQGIYCCYPTVPQSFGNYQLRIEKSVVQPEIAQASFLTTQSHVTTNTYHLFQTITRYSEMGARLICIEITGQEHQQPQLMMRPIMPALGCDLFFELPFGSEGERYVYNIVYVPIYVRTTPGFTPKIEVQCDWMGTLAGYLNQGWRLVEIFYDKTTHVQTSGFTTQGHLNSQWYFEKPASRANDATPMYEGTVVEHEVIFNGITTTTQWEPVIQNMGNKGWELACILETPEMTTKIGLTNKIRLKTLLFFQRKILSSVYGPAFAPVSGLPPSYDECLQNPVGASKDY